MFDMVLMDEIIRSSDFWKNITYNLKCSCESYLTLCWKSFCRVLEVVSSWKNILKFLKIQTKFNSKLILFVT